MLSRTPMGFFMARTPVWAVVKGKVASWMPGRGFGFVQDADNKEHFVHYSAVKVEPGAFRSLAVGQEVEFDIVTQEGRTRAENVTAPGGGFLPGGPRPLNDGNNSGRGRGRGFGGGDRRDGGGYRGRGDGGGYRGRGGDGGNRGYDRRDGGNQRGQAPPSDDF